MPRLEHRIGDLRHRVTIQQEDKVDDGYGGQKAATVYPADGSGWKKFAEVCADVEPLSGNEALVARQVQASLTHKVTMRYLPGVTAAMRIKFGSRFFNIREVRNFDERNWKLELRCEEGVAL